MRKIGIYNPYVETKGGGEKLCLSLASVLAEDSRNKVSVITHSKIVKDEIANYFNLDLSNVSFFVVNFEKPFFKVLARFPIPGRIKNYFSDYHVVRTVKKNGFDTFINNCYHSNLPNPCKTGVYLCMFPQKIIPKDSKKRL